MWISVSTLSEMPAYTILFRVRFLPVDRRTSLPSAKLPVAQAVTRGVAAAEFLIVSLVFWLHGVYSPI